MSTANTLSKVMSLASSSILTIAMLTGCLGNGQQSSSPSSSSVAPSSSSKSSVVPSSSSSSSSQVSSVSVPLPSGPPVQTRQPNAETQRPAFDGQTRAPGMTTQEPYQYEEITRGLGIPWGLQFMPDGRALLTERQGRVRIISAQGVASDPLSGVPTVFAPGGSGPGVQAGLLDVTIAPDFATSRMVYLSYAESRSGGKACTTVGRGKLSSDDRRLENFEVIFRQNPEWAADLQWGSRLVWSPEGHLYITVGERSITQTRIFAQDLEKTYGKVLRVNPDGSPVAGNPFPGNDERAKVWTYGHRNMQAAAIQPETGVLWGVEHGPQGGDELNRLVPGKNYGWPTITYGEDYFTGAKLGEGTQKSGMEQPVYYWDPVIAPSGMIFYSGNMFPEWRGNIFVGSLTPGGVVRLMIRNDKVVGEQILLKGRTRDVEQAPDGSIWVMKDDGTITRIFK